MNVARAQSFAVPSFRQGAGPGCPSRNHAFKARNAKRPMQSMHRAFWNVAAAKKLLFEAAHCGGVETAVYVHDFAADA